MRLDRMTLKAREALDGARRLAEKSEHQELLPEHVLFALMEAEDGVVRAIDRERVV